MADDEDRRYDPAKVIPPTRTDVPDSVVGGRPTRDFPDCCAVSNGTGFFCSGTLIAPTLVITAGHCEPVDRVFIGGWDVAEPGSGQIIMVDHQIWHPRSDLRVLVLAEASDVTPRHVAQGLEARADAAHLVGFGAVNVDGTRGYGIKREVTVPVKSLDCAADGDPQRYGCRPMLELVAGHRGLAMDSCHGDSGGPLYIRSPEGPYYLLGATSRGITGTSRPCGDGGIYVRVDRHLDWIREATGVAVEGPLL